MSDESWALFMSEMYADKLRQLVVLSDTEAAHQQADEILCDLLTMSGFSSVVDEWRKIKKWYA